MKFLLALWFGKAINFLINIIDKTRGSNFSGEKALLIDKQMVAHFKGIDPKNVLCITSRICSDEAASSFSAPI